MAARTEILFVPEPGLFIFDTERYEVEGVELRQLAAQLAGEEGVNWPAPGRAGLRCLLQATKELVYATLATYTRRYKLVSSVRFSVLCAQKLDYAEFLQSRGFMVPTEVCREAGEVRQCRYPAGTVIKAPYSANFRCVAFSKQDVATVIRTVCPGSYEGVIIQKPLADFYELRCYVVGGAVCYVACHVPETIRAPAHNRFVFLPLQRDLPPVLSGVVDAAQVRRLCAAVYDAVNERFFADYPQEVYMRIDLFAKSGAKLFVNEIEPWRAAKEAVCMRDLRRCSLSPAVRRYNAALPPQIVVQSLTACLRETVYLYVNNPCISRAGVPTAFRALLDNLESYQPVAAQRYATFPSQEVWKRRNALVAEFLASGGDEKSCPQSLLPAETRKRALEGHRREQLDGGIAPRVCRGAGDPLRGWVRGLVNVPSPPGRRSTPSRRRSASPPRRRSPPRRSRFTIAVEPSPPRRSRFTVAVEDDE